MKKIFSILLVVAMLFAMTTTAFAAETTGKITVENTVEGETYTIYRMLDLESYNAVTDAYSYKVNAKWESWLRSQTAYFAVDDQGYVTWNYQGEEGPGYLNPFIEAALAHAKTVESEASAVATGDTVVFDDLSLGYYLMDTSLGTLCSLDTTNPNVIIQEKNSIPSLKKEVEEDSTNAFGKTDDANIGQVVNFKTTVTAQAGAEGYIVHDILSEGLTLNQNSIAVSNNNTSLTEDIDYTVAFDQSCTGKDGNAATCDFHIVFAQDYLDTLAYEQEIVITYSATVNSDAVVGLPGNPNDTRLQYSTDNYTEWDTTITYTWDMGVLKYGNNDKTNVLADAKFVLLDNDKDQVAIFAGGKFTGWEAAPTADAAWPAGAELTTGADGKIAVEGLDADTYYLRETQAPAGYNKLADDVQVEITGAATSNTATLTYTTVVMEINNNSGTELPETGATGTMMFITTGSILAMIAVVFMVTRKKMSIYEM